MNRRRRFGSTILLSSLAALAVVGTGLAVGGTLLAEGSQDFNVTFTDNTKPEMGTVVVSEELKSTTLDVVFDDDGGTVAFSNDIVFEYTPAEGTNLEGKVLSLDYTATFTPYVFLTYFDVANATGTLAVDPVATTADGVYTFTLKKDHHGRWRLHLHPQEGCPGHHPEGRADLQGGQGSPRRPGQGQSRLPGQGR